MRTIAVSEMRAGALAAVAVLLTVAAAVAGQALALEGAYAFNFVSLALLGGILAWRRPHNAIGWLLASIGVLGALNALARAYAVRGLASDPGSLAIPELAAWYQSWAWLGYVGALNSLLILFPDGRPRTARWRAVLWAGWAFVLVSALGTAFFSRQPDEAYPAYVNPYAIALLWDWPPFMPLVFLGLFLGAFSLLWRARRASGHERQQLKWLGYAVTIFATTFAGGLLARALRWDLLADVLGSPPVFFVTFSAIPAAIAVAVLRYRLYDIDLLINRTLVYGATSAGLLATYVLSVLALSTLLRPVTGSSDLAVAGSTLAVVALFGPLRQRIQRAVDRRFARSRYDAERTVDAFTARLRDDVDLDSLRSDLLGVAHETVHPAHAGLWLRGVGR